MFSYLRCAEVTESLSTLTSLSKSGDQRHKELFSARIKRDYDDFTKIQCWFKSHNPFEAGSQLVALDSDLVDDKNAVTCNKAEEIGASIQTGLDGKTFSNCSFKRKYQMVTLQSLHSSVKIGTENVTIDPLTLFLRLIIVVERKPENEIVNYFNYELSPYPMSLSKVGIMRSSQKSKLKSFLLKEITITEEPESTKIADGGALLWCCDWKKSESFQKIFKKYSDLLTYLKLNIVVFDGYSLSTKDITHQKRSGRASQTTEMKDTNPCPSDRNGFLSNYTNKEAFVKALAAKLELQGFRIVQCPSDADTTIVKVALQATHDKPVTVYSDDTDVLCLLIHHTYFSSDPPAIFLTNMTRKKSNQHPRRYQQLK